MAKMKKNLGYKVLSKKKSLNDSIYSIKFFNSIVAFFIDKKKCIDKKDISNLDLVTTPSEIIKENFINSKWSSEVYTTGFVNKLFIVTE